MGLADLSFKLAYRSNEGSLANDFFGPCISESKCYDRAAGYFTSESLIVIAEALEPFLFKKGKIRLIVNPKLREEDVHAIELGYKAREDVIEWALLQEIKPLRETIEKEPLNLLAWLIAEELLNIKVAYMESNGIYHEKFGIFYDEEGMRVAFIGSANETKGGLKKNFEQIAVFTEQEEARIELTEQNFEKLWSNKINGLTIKDIPSSIKEQLLTFKGEYPSKKKERIEQRPYQSEAIIALRDNGWRGILEMATGTGKTITSLLAADQYLMEKDRMMLVIIAPYVHLADQWERELRNFNFGLYTNCYDSKIRWLDDARNKIRRFNLKMLDRHVLITTYKTYLTDHFQELMHKVEGNLVLIADECHNLGSRSYRFMSFEHYDACIGLSATPNRWWDDEGTAFVKDVFNKVVFEYSLERAIIDRKLTQYRYSPIISELTDEELEQYKELTHKIVKAQSQEDIDRLYVDRLMQQRALIVARAEQKVQQLITILQSEKIEDISHTLVYVAPAQIDLVTRRLADIGLRVHKFDSSVDRQTRVKLLKQFDQREIQVLVAIKCLDEGVDVPSTRRAFFLASTTNPREFVQRRGRILRKAPNKTIAELYDFVVMPQGADDETFKSIVKKEMPRFAEFASAAINSYAVRSVVLPYLAKYQLEHLLDIKPWEAYHATKEEY